MSRTATLTILTEWHLHQDLVLALNLKREGDKWLAMDEGYIEVVRLTRSSGKPVLSIEMRSEHLPDYLCARGMALRVSSYRDRQQTVDDASSITWPEYPTVDLDESDRWEGRVTEIIEGGFGFGDTAAVMQLTREDVDFEEDMPRIGPTDRNIAVRSLTIKREGRKIYRVQGELWRNEWLRPGALSIRVRGDKEPPAAFSSVMPAEHAAPLPVSAGKVGGCGSDLRSCRLWSQTEVAGSSGTQVIRAASNLRQARTLRFVSNKLGYVNVYATDIANLRAWQQRLSGRIQYGAGRRCIGRTSVGSAEGRPARTRAPETYLTRVLERLNELARAHASAFACCASTRR